MSDFRTVKNGTIEWQISDNVFLILWCMPDFCWSVTLEDRRASYSIPIKDPSGLVEALEELNHTSVTEMKAIRASYKREGVES